MSQLDSLEQFIRYGINYQVLEPLRRQRALDYAEKKAAEKDTLTMNHYGMKHHKGFKTGAKSMIKGKKVPPRPFIEPDKQEILTVFDAFKRDLSRNFRK